MVIGETVTISAGSILYSFFSNLKTTRLTILLSTTLGREEYNPF
nr:MAG TPA: hypothetical protein [Caudoviricetes sp.]